MQKVLKSWKTNYRGEILIRAGKGIDKKAMEEFKYLNFEFPTSKIMANEKINSENNIAYGFNERVGYSWKLKNIKKLILIKLLMVNNVFGILKKVIFDIIIIFFIFFIFTG